MNFCEPHMVMNKAVFEQCKCNEITEPMKKHTAINKKMSLIFPGANIREQHNMQNDKHAQK